MDVSVGKAAKVIGVSASTMRKWDNEKKLKAEFRTKGGHRRFSMEKLMKEIRKKDQITISTNTKNVLVYARVSCHKQKDDLKRQINYLSNYSKEQGWKMKNIYQDIASGMNDERNGLFRLLKAIPIIQPYAVLLTYKDRIARFGTALIDLFCSIFGTKTICINENPKISKEEQLMNDFLVLITSFTGKLHRRRRGKNKENCGKELFFNKFNIKPIEY